MHRDLIGMQKVNSSKVIEKKDTLLNGGACLTAGGCFTPPDCVPRQRVAILIPYKDREAHLYTLLNYLHPMLQRTGFSRITEIQVFVFLAILGWIFCVGKSSLYKTSQLYSQLY